jgi:methylthioribose-1-phosphate isomerase
MKTCKYEPIRYERGKLDLLDQVKLPNVVEYVPILTCEETHNAIRTMIVRGAPAIAIAAALGLAVESFNHLKGEMPPSWDSPKGTANDLKQKLSYLSTSRPTGVNLHNMVRSLQHLLETLVEQEDVTVENVVMGLVEGAELVMEKDIQDNWDLSFHGAEHVLSLPHLKEKKGIRMMTHCNAGALAVSKYGTAVGVVRAVACKEKLEHIYATETRPYRQGARLTMFELVSDGLPATLVCDSSACFVMSYGKVDVIVVGADRICANGDTANKIGTLMLAVCAKRYGIPFFIAAPTTTIDLELKKGWQIPIEERSEDEIVLNDHGERTVVEGANVWNPSFDVTPAELIAGIITEKGVIVKEEDQVEFDVQGFLGH